MNEYSINELKSMDANNFQVESILTAIHIFQKHIAAPAQMRPH